MVNLGPRGRPGAFVTEVPAFATVTCRSSQVRFLYPADTIPPVTSDYDELWLPLSRRYPFTSIGLSITAEKLPSLSTY